MACRSIRAHQGLPAEANVSEFQLQINGRDFYKTIARKGETLLIGDVNAVKGWSQPDWLPRIVHGWACRYIQKIK